MKMRKTRFFCGVMALLAALGLSAFGASAATVTDKSYILTAGEQAGIYPEPNQAAFWEYPTLSAGQSREDGVLRLVNNGGEGLDFRLKAVALPYGNEEALTYLDALRLRVTDGDEVLYDGPYTRVMDEDGLEIKVQALAAGDEKAFGVAMYAAFDYTGDPQQAAVQVNWLFEAGPATVQQDMEVPGNQTWVLIVIGAAAVLLVASVAAGIVCRPRPKARH